MNLLGRGRQNIPFSWFVFLPLLGAFQKVGVLLGWLVEGTWLNFILLLTAPIIWTYLVLQRTERLPFNPLLLMGLSYGFYMALIHFIYWLITQEPLRAVREVVTFDDFYHSINELLVLFIHLLANVMLGLMIGVITGLIANRIFKRNQMKR